MKKKIFIKLFDHILLNLGLSNILEKKNIRFKKANRQFILFIHLQANANQTYKFLEYPKISVYFDWLNADNFIAMTFAAIFTLMSIHRRIFYHIE